MGFTTALKIYIQGKKVREGGCWGLGKVRGQGTRGKLYWVYEVYELNTFLILF